MTITASGVDKRLDIGKVFQQTIEALQRNLAPFSLLSLMLGTIPQLGNLLAQTVAKGNLIAGLIGSLVGIAGLVTYPMLQGALIYGTVQDLNGSTTSMQDCLRVGSKRWLPLLGVQILAALGIFLGALLVIVPGILLALRWAVSAPALVMEGRGVTDAMGRSASLTQGRRGGVFLLFLVVWIVAAVFEGAFFSLAGGFSGLAAMATRNTPRTALLLVGPLLGFFFNLLLWPLIAALFHQLRATREGATPESLAEVFA